MKKLSFILIGMCLMIGSLLAQTPGAFKYQAVVRDNAGQIIVNQNVGFRISILEASASGPSVYSEKHIIQTNAFGLVNLEIGNGTNLSGLFSAIDWGRGSYFVKIELDASNNGSFSEMGTSQLLAVPYALYASEVGSGFKGSYLELTEKPFLFSGSYPDLTNKPNFAQIATTGSYADLLNKPVLFSGSYPDLTNKPAFATVATSGKYDDLLSKPNLAAIATSGSFTDLLNKPNFVTTTTTLQSGDVLYYNGAAWQLLPKGLNGQTLRVDQGLPTWGEPGYALPMVTTNAVTDVLQTGAISGGNVIATGYTNISARGVCWSTNQNPTVADGKTSEPAGIGTFTSTITGLLANTTYYARAYATNAAGTAYGNQVTFKTFLTVVFPTVTTSAAINISENAAASGGNVTATGGAEVTAKGICWGTNQNPTIADNKTIDGTGTGQFTSQMRNLAPGTIYYVRAYATNSAGTGYGNQISLTVLKTLPVVTTKNVTDLSSMGGVTGGILTSTGGGTISERGICWGETPNPSVLDNKEISVSTQASYSLAIIKATKPNTTYYVKAYAINELGVAYGEQKSFTTSEAHYYTSFEMGMTPASWSGPWTVTNINAFDGSYSFKSLIGQDCDAIFSTSITKSGFLIFYYSFKDWAVSVDVYVDDIKIANFPNDGSGWRQGLIELSIGNHLIRWHYIDNPGNIPFSGSPANGNCYIDHITITK